MTIDFVLLFVPFIFVFLNLYILFELHRINKKFRSWELKSLMFIPVIFSISYLYIGLSNPSIEIARLVSRFAMMLSLGFACHISYAYSKTVRKRGKQ